ncbi:MAG: aminopeptidase P N-terminal domain-containing protein [Gemmatimonadetes bacterium]|nr:aminopeptidase P N-terminal domain-containing protein [Gemmatimonadota bacterium]MDA1104486.1 aminopeptidase P N-terminal domain-containing protein [Gemmatimonadota bacterium]
MAPDRLPPVPAAVFAARRAAAFERLGDGIMVLPAAPIQYSSRDTERSYCPDRELYYLTGLIEAESVAVLAGGAAQKLVLFVRERDAEAELWAGPRMDPAAIGDLLGADECHSLSEMEKRLPELLATADRIHFRSGRAGTIDAAVQAALDRARARGPRTGSGPRGVVDPGEVIDDLRMIKDEHELALIRRACAVSIDGQRAAASKIMPGAGEWMVEAAVESAFRDSGATGPGFGTIVGSGVNACVLHYVDNADRIAEDALVLVDAGAELGLYHGDITRTYPASGRFSAAQGRVYDIVEAAMKAGIAAAAPGASLASVHEASTRVLVEGLVDLRVLEGGVDDLIAEGAHKVFFPHQTSHWLGLDVHDPGDYVRDGAPRTLAPGMVFTVEPGLYFRPESCAEGAGELAGIGIRIEDDVVITDSGCEVLTRALSTARADIESMIGVGS